MSHSTVHRKPGQLSALAKGLVQTHHHAARRTGGIGVLCVGCVSAAFVVAGRVVRIQLVGQVAHLAPNLPAIAQLVGGRQVEQRVAREGAKAVPCVRSTRPQANAARCASGHRAHGPERPPWAAAERAWRGCTAGSPCCCAPGRHRPRLAPPLSQGPCWSRPPPWFWAVACPPTPTPHKQHVPGQHLAGQAVQ